MSPHHLSKATHAYKHNHMHMRCRHYDANCWTSKQSDANAASSRLSACLLVSPAATPRSFARAAVASAAWYAARASAHCPRYSCCTAAACSATASISATAAHRLRVRPPFTARPTATVPLSSGEPQACSSRVEALHACRAAFSACLCRPCDDATAKQGRHSRATVECQSDTHFLSVVVAAGRQASKQAGWMDGLRARRDKPVPAAQGRLPCSGRLVHSVSRPQCHCHLLLLLVALLLLLWYARSRHERVAH